MGKKRNILKKATIMVIIIYACSAILCMCLFIVAQIHLEKAIRYTRYTKLVINQCSVEDSLEYYRVSIDEGRKGCWYGQISFQIAGTLIPIPFFHTQHDKIKEELKNLDVAEETVHNLYPNSPYF